MAVDGNDSKLIETLKEVIEIGTCENMESLTSHINNLIILCHKLNDISDAESCSKYKKLCVYLEELYNKKSTELNEIEKSVSSFSDYVTFNEYFAKQKENLEKINDCFAIVLKKIMNYFQDKSNSIELEKFFIDNTSDTSMIQSKFLPDSTQTNSTNFKPQPRDQPHNHKRHTTDTITDFTNNLPKLVIWANEVQNTQADQTNQQENFRAFLDEIFLFLSGYINNSTSFEILIDTNTPGFDGDKFCDDVMNKSHVYFVFFDEEKNVAGAYMDVEIKDTDGTDGITDKNAFLFSILRNGCSKYKVYPIKEDWANCSCSFRSKNQNEEPYFLVEFGDDLKIYFGNKEKYGNEEKKWK
ncbi:hypothetical protein QTN25_008054 [Entamoeba marina]